MWSFSLNLIWQIKVLKSIMYLLYAVNTFHFQYVYCHYWYLTLFYEIKRVLSFARTWADSSWTFSHNILWSLQSSVSWSCTNIVSRSISCFKDISDISLPISELECRQETQADNRTDTSRPPSSPRPVGTWTAEAVSVPGMRPMTNSNSGPHQTLWMQQH